MKYEIWNYESGIGKDGISNGASTMMDLNNNCVGQSLSGSPYSLVPYLPIWNAYTNPINK